MCSAISVDVHLGVLRLSKPFTSSSLQESSLNEEAYVGVSDKHVNSSISAWSLLKTGEHSRFMFFLCSGQSLCVVRV